MGLIVQATTITGNIIEGARWELKTLYPMQEGQLLSLTFPTNDESVINYLNRIKAVDCVVDKPNENEYGVSVSCVIKRIRHMIDTQTGSIESMALATPGTRLAELIMVYLIDPKKCDPKFVKTIRS